MPAKSIDPLKKVTVDLFRVDVDYLQNHCENFSEVLRKLLRDHVLMLKATKHRMTLGDLKGHHYEGNTKVYHSDKDYRND